MTREEMDMRQPDTVKSALAMRRAYSPAAAAPRPMTRWQSAASRLPTPPSIWMACGCWATTTAKRPSILISSNAELLRGLISVLYGKSNPGGLVSMVSKRPTTEPLREIQFKMGADNLFQTGFDFSDALDDQGIYSYRLTGLAKDSDTQQNMSKRSAMRSRRP